MSRKICALFLILFVLLNQPGSAWGDRGHQLINRVALAKAPTEMPEFFRNAGEHITYLGPEPDRWRVRELEPTLVASQAPDHYINFEKITWMRELPQSRFEYIKRLYERRATVASTDPDGLLPQNVGFQPYITIEIYDRLKVAFREYRKAKAEGKSTLPAERNAAFYAGWLGHYVADGANPMHNTIHHDGWVGENPQGFRSQRGLHWEFENDFVNRNADKLKIDDLVGTPKKLEQPFQDYVQWLRDSQAQLETLYKIEKAGGFKASTPEAVEFTRKRLGEGAQMLLNLWYTAWVESEKPIPPRRSE